jgi:hypothetical protein
MFGNIVLGFCSLQSVHAKGTELLTAQTVGSSVIQQNRLVSVWDRFYSYCFILLMAVPPVEVMVD